MTSFLLSTDINEGGKFELTAPISGKEEKKRKIHQYYNIEFLGNQFEKLMEVNAVVRSLRWRKVSFLERWTIWKMWSKSIQPDWEPNQQRQTVISVREMSVGMFHRHQSEAENRILLYLLLTSLSYEIYTYNIFGLQTLEQKQSSSQWTLLSHNWTIYQVGLQCFELLRGLVTLTSTAGYIVKQRRSFFWHRSEYS